MSVYLHYYLDMRKQQDRSGRLPSLDEVKKNYVNYLLVVTHNNLEETAEILDVPPISLKKRINPVIASEAKQSR